MKRILFISHYLNRNGTEAFMMNVYRRLDRCRYKVDFLLFTKEQTDYTREIEGNGDHVWRLPSRRSGLRKYRKALDQFFCSHAKEYDAIHWCTGNLSSAAPLRAAARWKVPIRIVHSHNSNSSGLHNKLLHTSHRHIASRLATHRLACSESAAAYFFKKKPAQIIRNGIDTELFQFSPALRQEVRAELKIKDDELVVGHVGRFNVVKNHRKLLSIFHQLINDGRKARLLLIGEGETMVEMKAYAHQLAIEDQIIWIGVTDQVNRYLQAMDAFVMPSLFEGLPFVLVEAQTAGLPCVLSNTIQQDSKINDNVCFLPLDADNAQWAQKIKELAAPVRKDLSANVRAAGYDIETTIQQMEKIYNS